MASSRSAEERNRRAQRMEMLGHLTGSIAHDFNNLLTAIIGPLDLALGSIPEDHAIRGDLVVARTAAGRAANLSRQLLSFSKRRVIHPRVFDLNQVISELRPLIKRLVRGGVDVDFGLAEETLPVHMDQDQFEQVIMNLVVNSSDAMPEGGALRIKTFSVAGSSAELRRTDKPWLGRHAVFMVADTGVGMSAETKLRVFEPYFTTKSGGTGLGLATAYGVVSQAGGFIRVESVPGQGAAFHVFIPITDQAIEPQVIAAAPIGFTGKTILVVDDEEVVRSLIQKALERLGHKALAASDADAAIRIWNETKGAVDLLLTDVVMPDISGLELAKSFLARRPNLPILFISGYASDEVIREVAASRMEHLLEKPFSVDELVAAVDTALNLGATGC